ncbi:MAG: hypothetical protein GC160_26025 [Acidobacteria bacterium]|nr:hypothetical protein [Acidobacteriota bacterium]
MKIRAQRGRSNQGGFALIAILFGAAVLAIVLARALPRDAMSAQRVREERLINHGEEYARAIQLYFRENKKYPEELDDLEDTNGVRYLRRRYKDPITGEDEWRLIHMGTDGRFKDSLVYDLEDEEGAEGGDPNSVRTSGSSGMGSLSRSGSSDARRARMQASAGAVMTGFDGAERALKERESAAPDPTDRSAQGPYGGPFPGQEGAANQQPELGPDGQPVAPDYSATLPENVPANAGQAQPGQMPIPGLPTSRGGIGSRRDARQNRLGGGLGGSQQQSPTATPGGFPGMSPTGGVAPQAADVIQKLLTTPRPGGLAGLRGAQNALQQQQGQQGQTFQEGVAGVASKAQSKGVKVYKGEEQFNLWEFVYDYRKDQAMAGMMAGMGGQGAGNIDPTQPGLTPGGMMGGAPGGAAGPGAFGAAGPGAFGGAAGPGAFGAAGAQPGMQPADPTAGYQPPDQTTTAAPTDPADRPQRGTGGATGPGTVPTLPGQTTPDMQNLPADVQEMVRRQMEQMQQMQQQQQQQSNSNRSRQLTPSSASPQPNP